jgi:glycosyltransferase involved in cell wall biosynthesis
MPTKVSIITVCRNAAASIETCLRSVTEQSYNPIEYIVIDGSSTDQTLKIIERYRAAIAVLVSEPDGGIYSAMNKGLLRARGDLVYFINADDHLLDRHVIRDVVGFIDSNSQGDVYYGSIEIPGENNEKLSIVPDVPEKAAETFVCGCLPHQATFARRRVFDRTGLFNEDYRRHADYDWFLKVVADPELKMIRFERAVAFFNCSGASSQLALGQPEVFRIQNASPLYQSENWSRRRIEILQEAFLAARIENAELKRELRAGIREPGAFEALWALRRYFPRELSISAYRNRAKSRRIGGR